MTTQNVLKSVQKVFEVLNQMEADGVIDAYALGGAIAASVYVEPFATEDIDFFVHFTSDVSDLDPLRPIINYLTPKGYTVNGVEFNIDEWLVQFIPVYNELVDEATQKSLIEELDGVQARIISPEYLVAIMLNTERPKDLVRAKMFLDQEAVNLEELGQLIQRFDLEGAWKRVKQL